MRCAYTSNKPSVFGFIGSRITRTHDFGFVALDMTHVRGEDEGVYICRASNALGEAVTTASMKIRSKLLNCIHKVLRSPHIAAHYKQRNCMGKKCD